MDYDEFCKSVKKVSSKRKTKGVCSFGTREIYRWIKKNKFFGTGVSLTEAEFGRLIKDIHLEMREAVLEGREVILPARMGNIELKRKDSVVTIKDGKLNTNKFIDWSSTLKLWHDDEESFKNKKLVKADSKDIYWIVYNKSKAVFDNRVFYRFTPCRSFKKELSDKVNNNEINLCFT